MSGTCRGCLLSPAGRGVLVAGYTFCSASCAASFEVGHQLGVSTGRALGAHAARKTCATTGCKLCLDAIRQGHL